MKRIILFSTIVIVVIMAMVTVFVDSLYATEIGSGNGDYGNAYTETVKCTKIVRTHSITCACFADPDSGKPAFDHQYTESISTYYRTATLCHYNYVTIEWCTETNPCIE